mgnify:CR=1 FL=1
MEWRLIDGDYVPDGRGGLTALDGGEEVLARVLFRLTARRGGLPFLPRLGSRLYQLSREKVSARQALAVQYVAEALQEEPDLSVQAVHLDQTGETLRYLLNATEAILRNPDNYDEKTERYAYSTGETKVIMMKYIYQGSAVRYNKNNVRYSQGGAE